MFQKNQIILLTVMFLTSAAGLVWPDQGRLLGPALAPMMAGMLFLSFLKIRLGDVLQAVREQPGRIAVLALIKLVLLPTVVYLAARQLVPEYALGLLLLAGVSTGVTAPFFTAFIGGQVALTTVMAASTSLILPVSLPLMVEMLAGRAITFDLMGMALLLAAIIFIPLVGVSLGRKFTPGFMAAVEKRSFPVSLVVMSLINFGAFGRYAPYLKGNPEQILVSLPLVIILALAAFGIGMLLLRGSSREMGVTSGGTMLWINNVLIIVLGAELGDPLSSVMAALYMIPCFGMIVPLAHLLREKQPVAEQSAEALAK